MRFVLLLVFVVAHSSSQPVNDTIAQWLPKCCPGGKILTGDGKACVVDDNKYLEYNTDDVASSNFAEDVLSITVDNTTSLYKLNHETKFNCARQEIRVVDDHFSVTAEGDVVVEDYFGSNWTLPSSEVCVDSMSMSDPAGLSPDRVFVALLCPPCTRVSCFHKCCLEDHQLQVSDDGRQVNCVPSSDTSGSWIQDFLENNSKRNFVFHGFPECSNSPYLEYPVKPLRLTQHGHLRLSNVTVPRTEYCADTSSRGPALLACRQVLTGTLKPTVYGSLFCLGAVFLTLTLVLHLWLPELRKTLHSRVLVAHVSCLLASYLGLALVNLVNLPAPSSTCSATAFFIQFSILAAIFWLNVMCVDIAWTFSGLRAPKASLNMDSDGRKFLYYSLYAWGSTAIISVVTAVLEFSSILPSTSRFKPSFGISSCWFQYWEPILLLVYGPMGVLLLINIVLFVYTACKIRRTQKDAANLVQHAGSKLRENKDRFTLYLKLFGLMGVTWVFEILSWVVQGPESFWYFTDIINALRSVFIFALFCLKKKVILLVKAKLSSQKAAKFPINSRKSPSSSKMTSSISSQRTNSIQLSQIS